MEKNRNQTPPPGSKPGELTARQEKLLSFLAGNPNIQAAANAAGVGRTTVHRWLKEPAFREELTRRRNLALTEAMNSVQAYTAQAVEELIKLMGSPNEWLRRQICMDILNCSQKTMATEQIFQRLDALEKDRETNQSGRKQ
ncbi:MAG: hypothetical protein WCG03_01265 [Kiritimatiellales bacterium]